VNLRLRRIAAALFVVTAALFVIGVNAERHTHVEAPALDAGHSAAAPEGAAGHTESGEAGGGEAAPATSAEAGHVDSTGSERLLGVDVESAGPVAAAMVISLALAGGLWLRDLRRLAAVAALTGLVFAVVDVTEVLRKLDESQTGLAVLAGVIALGHALASGSAAWSTRS